MLLVQILCKQEKRTYTCLAIVYGALPRRIGIELGADTIRKDAPVQHMLEL